MKESRLGDWNALQDLYLKLKCSRSKELGSSGELLYCLFLLSKSNADCYSAIFSRSNSIECLKINRNDNESSESHWSSHLSNGVNTKKKNNLNRHTVYGCINDNSNYKATSKYNLLAKDLIFIFQGFNGKHIYFENEKCLFKFDRNDLFHANEIFFAKRLSVLGQNFKIIMTYSAKAMNNRTKSYVIQSFGSALNDEINEFYKLITSIQANLHKVDNCLQSHCNVTLHGLCIWTFETFIRFEALVKLINRCRSKKGGALISVVYDMMHHGDPLVKECLRKILSKVVKPIRNMLHLWIFYGELKDEYEEFFIYVNKNAARIIGTFNSVFWFDQFSINKCMLPGFINKSQAYKILMTGKAISILRELSKVYAFPSLYDQLKSSFENSNLETLFDQKCPSHQANEFVGLLDCVYREIGQTSLSILNAQYMLHEHFIAHKRFLLLEQGDFINYLMELLHPIINRPANKISVYTLSQTLENAIQKTNVQYDTPSEILSRIDIFFDQRVQNENAWDIFALKYRIDGPIGTIFSEQSQIIYSKLFSLFWRNKAIEFASNKSWVNLRLISRQVYCMPFEMLPQILNNFNYQLYQMISFIKTIQRFYNNLLESLWMQVKNELEEPRNLNKLIKVHQVFLQNLVKKFFFDNSDKLIAQQENINKSLENLVEKLDLFTAELGKFLQKNIEDNWHNELKQYEQDVIVDYNFWLLNYSRLLHNEISLFLQMLIDTDEDDLRELCFNIDFNKYYQMKNV